MTNNEIGPVYGPARPALPHYIGRRFSTGKKDEERWQNGAAVGIRDKAARRMLRKRAFNAHSTIEKSVRRAQLQTRYAQKLSDNCHEAKRNYEKLKLEAQREYEAKVQAIADATLKK